MQFLTKMNHSGIFIMITGTLLLISNMVLLTAWYGTGDKPLFEPIEAHFINAIWGHQATMG